MTITPRHAFLSATAKHGKTIFPDRITMSPVVYFEMLRDPEVCRIEPPRNHAPGDPIPFMGTPIPSPNEALPYDPVGKRCSTCDGTGYVTVHSGNLSCNHDNSTPLNQGPASARLYRCDDCGEEWERDVS